MVWPRTLLVLAFVCGGSQLPSMAEVKKQNIKTDDGLIGSLVDLAEFGRPLSAKNLVGVEWENLREVYEAHLIFPEGKDAPPVSKLRLEWWGSVWPNVGVGTYQPGWLQKDDHWNGKWVPVETKAVAGPKPTMWVYKFPPLTKKEWKRALPKRHPTYRGTLKVRVVSEEQALPKDCRLAVFGTSRWGKASFDVIVNVGQESSRAGRIDIINGKLLGISSLPPPYDAKIQDRIWSAEGSADKSAYLRIKVLYAETKNPHSNDLTRVTVRLGRAADATGFSFVPQQVLNEGTIRLRDLEISITESVEGMGLARDRGPFQKKWERCVRERIPERPETSYRSAMTGIPRLSPPMTIPIGVPSAEQEVFIRPLGEWVMWWPSLNPKGRESERCPFRERYKVQRGRDQPGLYAQLDAREDPQFDGKDRKEMRRYLAEHHLPLIHAEWRTGPIRYHHMMASTILLGDIGDDSQRRGDETVIFLSKMEITNTSDKPATATLNLRYSHGAPITLQRDGIIAIKPRIEIPSDLLPLRGQISVDRAKGGGIEGWTLKPAAEPMTSQILCWQATLKPGQTRPLYFKQPYVDLLDAKEFRRFKEISYEQEIPKVMDYWRGRMAGGMQIDVPVPALNHFYAANLWHNLITTDRDVKTGLYNQFVGTWGYMVFANETVMIARSMDMRGEHREAERFLEPMLHFQGSEPLTGNFSTKEGVFHGAGNYTHGKYAMNHGFVLWGVADHYLFTRDRAYLQRVAPKLIKGCDFLISERKSTMNKAGPEGSRISGLAPACALEDITEFKYWFATNSYYYLGMKRVVKALADIDHPDAERIAVEAEEYRKDIEKSLGEATTRASVVRLRDGSYIPFVPAEAFEWQHYTGGWVREALYCSLHAAMAEVVAPSDPLMTWMLDELEDNIFFSKQAGFGLKEVDKYWFERGAVTKQPCLLDTPIIYMARDEIPAALRSFWNTYALLIYPDDQCLAEWATNYGKPGGPFYKTSDESRFVMWLRQLLVWEDGDRLWLARATPRAWLEDGKIIRVERAPTYYGTVGLVIRSEVDSGHIYAEVTLPTRNPPKEMWLRLRHPQAKTPKQVLIDDKVIDFDLVAGEDISIIPGAKDVSRSIKIRAEY
ncbi:MAG: hypothetical protein JSV03_16720 [Planctomycetota bacterium]|nr:MAG: hypothetical protein JSV03_16720 [Planctomycetota bacterium]